MASSPCRRLIGDDRCVQLTGTDGFRHNDASTGGLDLQGTKEVQCRAIHSLLHVHGHSCADDDRREEDHAREAEPNPASLSEDTLQCRAQDEELQDERWHRDHQEQGLMTHRFRVLPLFDDGPSGVPSLPGLEMGRCFLLSGPCQGLLDS